MTNLTITSIVGLTPPFSGYVCDVYVNNCVYVGEITTTPVTITLPSQFNSAPAILLKLVHLSGCEKLMVLTCEDQTSYKQFQDGDDFFFMDYEIYQFQ